jgi:hypothetical protein
LQRQLKRKIAELDCVLRAFGPDGDADPVADRYPPAAGAASGGAGGGRYFGSDHAFEAQFTAREVLRQKLDAARRRAEQRAIKQ